MTDKEQFNFDMMIWLVLMSQAHRHGKSIRQQVHFEMAHKLNTWLASSNAIYNYCKRLTDTKAIEQLGNDFRDILEALAQLPEDKRPQFLQIIKEGLAANAVTGEELIEVSQAKPFELMPGCSSDMEAAPLTQCNPLNTNVDNL